MSFPVGIARSSRRLYEFHAILHLSIIFSGSRGPQLAVVWVFWIAQVRAPKWSCDRRARD
jgi:hypothetical protein